MLQLKVLSLLPTRSISQYDILYTILCLIYYSPKSLSYLPIIFSTLRATRWLSFGLFCSLLHLPVFLVFIFLLSRRQSPPLTHE